MSGLALSATVPKLIRLLASDQDHEALGAARALARVCDLNSLGDLIEGSVKAPIRFAPPPTTQRDWKHMARWCCEHRPNRLSEREYQFVFDMAYRRMNPPTNKQMRWLQAIYELMLARPR